MTEADITKEVMRGRLVVVGELRGTHAESAGYVDRRTGEAIKYVRVIYLIECACRGMIDRARFEPRCRPGNCHDGGEQRTADGSPRSHRDQRLLPYTKASVRP